MAIREERLVYDLWNPHILWSLEVPQSTSTWDLGPALTQALAGQDLLRVDILHTEEQEVLVVSIDHKHLVLLVLWVCGTQVLNIP